MMASYCVRRQGRADIEFDGQLLACVDDRVDDLTYTLMLYRRADADYVVVKMISSACPNTAMIQYARTVKSLPDALEWFSGCPPAEAMALLVAPLVRVTNCAATREKSTT